MLERDYTDLDALDFVYDPRFRAELEVDPHAALADRGMTMPENTELRVHVNTSDTTHVVFPGDPNATISDEGLQTVAGGSTVGSAATTTTASTASSGLSCLGSASSASTASTVGSAQID